MTPEEPAGGGRRPACPRRRRAGDRPGARSGRPGDGAAGWPRGVVGAAVRSHEQSREVDHRA